MYRDSWEDDKTSKTRYERRKGSKLAKCDVRLTRDEDMMLEKLAAENEVTRSEIMRKALRDFMKFNGLEE